MYEVLCYKVVYGLADICERLYGIATDLIRDLNLKKEGLKCE